MKTSDILLHLSAAFGASAASIGGLQIHERASSWKVGQTVQTSSGPVSGHAATNSKNNSGVSEYLGIPFAQPPVGDLRFAAPVKYAGNSSINGTSFGPSCPVRKSNSSSIPSADVLEAANLTVAGLAMNTIFSDLTPNYSEDCLYVNVWTKPQTGDTKKAVLVWIYGGGFSSGSTSYEGYNGASIVEQEDVVVVSLNYRLSILGFPGNPTSTNNLALLDQRLAIEWVRDNIENFGGDKSRITLFGQSAGGASVDYYSYAWNSDPIAAGFIPESGTVFSWGLPNAKSVSAVAWFNVTTKLGCGNASSDAASVLSCMRSKDYASILSAIPSATGTTAILGFFGPTVDDTVVFSNYTDRTPAKVPVLVGSNNYESGYFRTQFALAGITYPDVFWDIFNLQEFTCPTGLRANASVSSGNPTWRYRYFGVFPNTAISSEAGAYHSAELPILFDTAPTIPANTPEEVSIGQYMRGAWAAFAKDPAEGLTKYGWPSYNASGDTLIRLAYDNVTGTNAVNPSLYDANCKYVNVSNTDPNAYTGLATAIPTATATNIPTASGTNAPAASTSKSAGSRVSCSFAMAIGFVAMWLL
ncbi:uncharacterized protein BP5553_03752 [Venustampulla echinocandica]|uniref:Carboxylic ester hydrolase n=1 Tax=Venustampulla echinocandica TaxID=2656787 RepID=A0A370TV45_9HELO|nr:uncharacterized protein BP5553_03752 [Venustampulla echinocandica]RDL39412.1 hypothetical protein BP5553_03752 [Venustampulla echinocandica]